MVIPVLAVMLVAISGTVSNAQEQGDNAPCSLGMRADGSNGVSPKEGAPFAATAKLTFEHKLPDNNKISGFARFHQARSSSGSTRNEVPQRCFHDADGTLKLAYSVNTYDAALQTSEYWNVYGDMVGWQTGVVHVSHAEPPRESGVTADGQAHQKRQEAEEKWVSTGYKNEQLGLKTMLGLSVVGMRYTRILQPGKEGNELQLEIIHEQWWSPELGQSLLAIDDDPRVGRTVYEMETIIRTEPERAQFLPPSGYAVKPVQTQ